MRRLQKNSSTAQRQECLSVSDTTVQHEKKKKKMLEYYKNIKKNRTGKIHMIQFESFRNLTD